MKQLILKFFFCITLLIMCIAVDAQGKFTPATVPNPKNATQNGWISDPAGYLKPEHADGVNQICDLLKEYVEVELAVVMLPDIDDVHYDAFDFCQELFNLWGIGGSKQNTGVLFFFCEKTRDIRIHTGAGMEGLLPDSKCGEIIDYEIDYFSNGEYSKGTLNICKDIYDKLMTQEAQAELLLGYKAKTNEDSGLNILYWISCIVLLLFVSFYIYKKVPQDISSVTLKDKYKTIEGLADKQTASGCLAWIFPIPMLFFYLFFLNKRKSIAHAPVTCPECGKLMDEVDAQKLPDYLSHTQAVEQEIESIKYNIWHCQSCGHNEIVSSPGKKTAEFRQCEKCGAKAKKRIKTRAITFATYTSAGLAERTFNCLCCNNTSTEQYTLPKLVHAARSSSSSRSYGSSSSSSSSGGSWGGGRSYGGGAGRKF